MATSADTARAYDDLLQTTLDNYRGKLVNNFFTNNVLSYQLEKKGSVRMLSGGEQIVEHLLTGENDDVRGYGEWQSVHIRPQGGIDVAKFNWGTLVGTIAISGLEEAKNNGEEAILSLLKARVQQTEKTMQRQFNRLLWGVSTITGANQSFGSVLNLIDDVATVGNINPSTNAWWRSPVHKTVNTTMNFAALQQRLTNLYNQASDGQDVVKFLVGAQNAFEMYELGLTPNVRYEDEESANAGFRNLMFKGVPFYWDKTAPNGTVIGVNPEYLSLVGHKNRWFKQSPFTASPIDGAGDGFGGANWLDARYSVISTFGQVTVNNRQRHFKLTNVGVAS
jgi:hypothetical protein